MPAHRFFPSLTFVAVLFLSALVVPGVAAQSRGEHVEMTPADGRLSTQFLFTGTGFRPGLTISARFYSPDGVERRIRTEEGAEFVWLVQQDGTFSLDLVPAQRFPGAPAGRWRVLFCAFGSPTCQQIEFDLAP